MLPYSHPVGHVAISAGGDGQLTPFPSCRSTASLKIYCWPVSHCPSWPIPCFFQWCEAVPPQGPAECSEPSICSGDLGGLGDSGKRLCRGRLCR